MMRKFRITVQGIVYEVDVEEVQAGASPAAIPAAPAAQPVPAPVAPPAPQAAPAPAAPQSAPVSGGRVISAPMPGTILSVSAQAGAAVKKGDVLCILEAMKMENEIMAPQDGQVVQVLTSKGASVDPGDALFVLS